VRCAVAVAAAAATVVAAAAVAAAVAGAAADAAELLLLLPHACVRPGGVQNGVHVSAPKVSMRTAACAGLGRRASVRAAGAGQWVQDGLVGPSVGARGPPGVARRRAWARRGQRHLTFADLCQKYFFLAMYNVYAVYCCICIVMYSDVYCIAIVYSAGSVVQRVSHV
jgi:hypothetical protein